VDEEVGEEAGPATETSPKPQINLEETSSSDDEEPYVAGGTPKHHNESSDDEIILKKSSETIGFTEHGRENKTISISLERSEMEDSVF
jgi:hypothetical protein